MKKFIEAFSQYRGLSRSAYVIFFGRLITNMGAFIWPMMTLILRRKMGYSIDLIPLIMIGVGLLYMPANILGGKLADKFDRKKIIIIFDLISVFFFMLCAFVEPGNLMMVFFVIAGLFANMEGPAYEALLADATKPAEREKVYSLMYLGSNLGLTVGATVGGLLFENYLNLAFIFDGTTTLISTLLIILFVKVIDVDTLDEEEKNVYEDHVEESESAITIIKERPSVFNQLMIFLLGAFVYDQFHFAIPLYLVDTFLERGAAMTGLLTSYNTMIVIVLTPIITVLLERYRGTTKIAVGQLLIALSFVFLFGKPPYFMFYVMMTFFTLGEIVNMLGSSPFMSRRVPGSHRGRVNSYRNLAFFIGGSGGRIIVGQLIVRFGYTVVFALMSVVGMAAVIYAIYNYKVDKSVFPKLYGEEAA